MQALGMTLMVYMILSLSTFGWGRVVIRFLRVKKQLFPFDITLIWLGWASILLIFQILHLFFPLTIYIVAPILIIGLIFSHDQIVYALRLWPKKLSTRLKLVSGLLIFLLLGAWIASRSMLSPTIYDSGLYYFNALRWINSFPITPGLGNLHGRLAFNQSFFLYAASLNFPPYFAYGRSIANSFIFLLTVGTLFEYLRPTFAKPFNIFQTHPFKFLPALFAIPITGYLAITSEGFTTPTPDLTSTLLQLILFVNLTRIIAEWTEGQFEQRYSVILITVLAATSITIKLSNLIFATVIIVFALVYTWISSHRNARELARILIPALVIILVWGSRGIILSGAPLFPSLIGYIQVDWAVPKESIVEEANWIYSWARQPDTHWSNTLNNVSTG